MIARRGFLLSAEAMTTLRTDVEAALAACHQRTPSAPGVAAEALRLLLPTRQPREAFAALMETLVQAGSVARDAHWLRLPSHRPGMDGPDAALWRRIEAILSDQPFRPPVLNDLAKTLRLDPPVLRRAAKRFAASGRLTEVAPDLFFMREALPGMAEAARDLTDRAPGGFSAVQFTTGWAMAVSRRSWCWSISTAAA